MENHIESDVEMDQGRDQAHDNNQNAMMSPELMHVDGKQEIPEDNNGGVPIGQITGHGHGNHDKRSATSKGPVDPSARTIVLPTDEDFIDRTLKKIPDYPIVAQTHFVWQISDWNALRRTQKVQSTPFECGGCQWRITLFPRSNSEAISIYLEPSPPTKDKKDESGLKSAENGLASGENGSKPTETTPKSVEIAELAVSDDTIDPTSAQSPPEKTKNWYVCAQFALDMWNPLNAAAHVSSTASHRFTTREQDWGFSSFISPRELTARGILEQNRLNVSACVRVLDDSSTGMLWHDFIDYDSKPSTGYVGLANQGATCYLNSLLQLYFVTGAFRALVYEIPTHNEPVSSPLVAAESDSKSELHLVNPKTVSEISQLNKIDDVPVTDIVAQLSIKKPEDEDANPPKKETTPTKRARTVALAMQRVLAHMQLALAPVSTLELTKSFGWDSSDAFTQHDVQELNRILMDTLEVAMRGSYVENKLNSLFVGAMKLYVKCVDVDYESSRVEPFWDIQLNVRGLANLQESFQNYVEPELLSGDNKYDAGGNHGYQDAKKGVFFQWFPPVLHLQLKRFEYDFVADDLVKIDDLYEYPDQIDLSPYLGDVPDSVREQNWTYKLHGVLVHQGSVSNGHYYAMLKPFANAPEGQTGWYRFDDDKVWKVAPNQVFHENFGARSLPPQVIRNLSRSEQNEYILRRATSAYMLVYYREESLPVILPDSGILIPNHVERQIEAEKEEANARTRQRIEALHYLPVTLVTHETFQNYSGFDIFPDPALKKMLGRNDYDEESYPLQLKVRKDGKMKDLAALVCKTLGYDNIPNTPNPGFDEFSLYTVKPRTNKTVRPEFLITAEMMEETVVLFYARHFKRSGEDMVLFAYEPKKDLLASAVSPKSLTADDNILFIKRFDAVANEVRGLAYTSVKRDFVLAQLQPAIISKLGLSSSTDLELLEEVSSLRIEDLDANLPVEKNELGTGDIITFATSGCGSAARAHYKFLYTRVHVRLHRSHSPVTNEFVVKNEHLDDLHAVELWVSAAWSYLEFVEEVAKKLNLPLGVDSEHLRIFVVEHALDADPEDEDAPGSKRYPISSFVKMSQVFPRPSIAATVQLEYEILTIPLAQYEGMRRITVHWLKTILQPELFDLHIPKESTVADLIIRVIEKFQIPKSFWPGLLAWTSVNFKFGELAKFETLLEEIPEDAEICCGYFPAEVAILVSYDMYKQFGTDEGDMSAESSDASISVPEDYEPVVDYTKVLRDEFKKTELYSKLLNLVPVFHFQKLTNYTHSTPFIFATFPEEKWVETARRLNFKLGLPTGAAADKMRVALADENDKGRYLDLQPDMVLFDEIGRHELVVFLALDHRDRSPRRAFMQEKGISIG